MCNFDYDSMLENGWSYGRQKTWSRRFIEVNGDLETLDQDGVCVVWTLGANQIIGSPAPSRVDYDYIYASNLPQIVITDWEKEGVKYYLPQWARNKGLSGEVDEETAIAYLEAWNAHKNIWHDAQHNMAEGEFADPEIWDNPYRH